MTSTQGTSEPPPQSQQAPGRQPGIDREHLLSYEQLRRSTTDRKVAGVAGGLGRHLDIDPTIVRVLLVVLCFFGGAGFLLYGVAWLVVPEDGRPAGALATRPGTRNAVLIASGLVAALLVVANGWNGPGFPWPVLLVGVGVVVYLAVRDRNPAAQPPAPQVTTPATGEEATAPLFPATGATATWVTAPVPATTATVPSGPPPAPPWATTAPAPYQPPRPKRGPRLFWPTLALVTLALGCLGLYDASGAAVRDSAYPALALAVVGVALVVGAFVGRAGGLVLLGLLASLALAVTSVAGAVGGFDDHRQVTVTATSAADVPADYTVNTGKVRVDLSGVRDAKALDGRLVDLHGGAAELVVVLPPGVRTEVRADIDGPGQIDLPDQSTGGIDNALSGTYGSGAATLTLVTHLSIGHIDVRNP
jgi:phage shock protein PspC (stress-responsive transcriptional regulator)